MHAAVDVHYGASSAAAACVLFDEWQASGTAGERTLALEIDEPYVPGQFYKREMPCILAILEPLDGRLQTIVIDGYVWLANGRPGLGQRLYEALDRTVRIIGVAKTAFAGNDSAKAVYRGKSKQPLYVTASGMDISAAANAVLSMHGAHRIPTLLKRADSLSRRASMDHRDA